jgi:hypothetical protein
MSLRLITGMLVLSLLGTPALSSAAVIQIGALAAAGRIEPLPRRVVHGPETSHAESNGTIGSIQNVLATGETSRIST